MDEQKCTCPICNRVVEPADGMTPDEHLVQGILALAREMQENGKLPNCPRCGYERMTDSNALSREYSIGICPECGTDEAVRAMNGNTLPTAEWWLVKEIYKLRRNIPASDE